MVLVCFTPTRAGTHPDLRAPGFAWPPGDLAKALKLHSDDPLYFFSKGALPVDLLKMTGVSMATRRLTNSPSSGTRISCMSQRRPGTHAAYDSHLVHQDDTLVPWPTLVLSRWSGAEIAGARSPLAARGVGAAGSLSWATKDVDLGPAANKTCFVNPSCALSACNQTCALGALP
jgi:hypothetical protein